MVEVFLWLCSCFWRFSASQDLTASCAATAASELYFSGIAGEQTQKENEQ